MKNYDDLWGDGVEPSGQHEPSLDKAAIAAVSIAVAAFLLIFTAGAIFGKYAL